MREEDLMVETACAALPSLKHVDVRTAWSLVELVASLLVLLVSEDEVDCAEAGIALDSGVTVQVGAVVIV